MSIIRNKVRFTKIPLLNIVKKGILWAERNLALGVINDGKENDFPKWWIDTVAESPTGSACVSRITDFIQGTDLHPDVKDLVINPETGETFEAFHSAICKDYALIDRFGIKLVPTRGGTLSMAKHIPFEWIRYQDYDNEEGEILFAKVNPYIATSQQFWNNSQVTVLKLFTGLDKMGGEENIIFYNESSPRNRIYSRPEFVSANGAMSTEAKEWEFHDRNTTNNFFLGGMITMVGDPDQRITSIDENGNEQNHRVGDVVEYELSNTLGGTDNAGKFAILWQSDINAPTPNFIPFKSGDSDEMFNNLDLLIERAICKATGVPQILLPVPLASGLGENNRIRNAIKFMNQRTAKKRKALEAVYRKFLPGFGVNIPEDENIIIPIADITDLPDIIFNALSPDQKTDYIEDNFGIERGEEIETQMQSEEEVENELQQIIESNAINASNNN